MEKAQESRQEYPLVGVVKNINSKTGLVTIRHEAIPGFMNAMTMPFTVKERSDLEDMYVGDEVEGKLLVIRTGGEVSNYELFDLAVSKPAERPPETGKPIETSPSIPLLKPGEIVPNFSMTDQTGKTFALSDLRGSVVALTFVYTRCPLPNFCPLMDSKFAKLAQELGVNTQKSQKVRLLSVSFDPEHDTPEHLAEHAKIRGAKPPLWTFAVASHSELSKVSAQLGLSYSPTSQEIVHNLSTALIDADGKLIDLRLGSESREWTPKALQTAIYAHLPQ